MINSPPFVPYAGATALVVGTGASAEVAMVGMRKSSMAAVWVQNIGTTPIHFRINEGAAGPAATTADIPLAPNQGIVMALPDEVYTAPHLVMIGAATATAYATCGTMT